MQQTFTDFKNDFYKRVPDLTLFDCGEINLLKVVLDGLRVNYNNKQTNKRDFLLPLFLYQIKSSIKRKIKFNQKSIYLVKQLTTYKNKVLIGFSQRLDNNIDEQKSIYFERIFNVVGKVDCIYIGERKEAINIADFYLPELISTFSLLSLNKKEKQQLYDLKNTYYKIVKSKIFNENELKGISYAFEIFFIHYKAWNKILENLIPKIAIFDQHYHREGFILACNNNKIETIELQHGLIVPEDIFYVFPKQTKNVVSRALFANKILVYGNYWKNNLLKGTEYSNNQIINIGFYHHVPKYNILDLKLLEYINSPQIILVTTQVNISEFYVNYIKILSKLLIDKKYNWKIIIKTHPSENINYYNEITSLANCKIVSYPIEYLFSISKIHISIYSTTLYDALRSDIFNFSLYNEKYKDYCNRIITDGIAHEIKINDDPIEKFLNNANEIKTDKNFYYEVFDGEKLLNVVQSK